MLVTCPDCKTVVSPRAHACQSCGSRGTPGGERTTALTALAFAALLVYALALIL